MIGNLHQSFEIKPSLTFPFIPSKRNMMTSLLGFCIFFG
uniref:Uncharacterized protein n=1 Tax=Rhizophora mucronata TaxID=61149 RepID=A0A2P2PLV1_RHIMU